MEFLNEYMIPVVLGICLVVGWVIKKWITEIVRGMVRMNECNKRIA